MSGPRFDQWRGSDLGHGQGRANEHARVPTPRYANEALMTSRGRRPTWMSCTRYRYWLAFTELSSTISSWPVFYRVLLGFTWFYRVLLSFAGVSWLIFLRANVLPSCTGFCIVLCRISRIDFKFIPIYRDYLVWSGFTGFSRSIFVKIVLPSFTGRTHRLKIEWMKMYRFFFANGVIRLLSIAKFHCRLLDCTRQNVAIQPFSPTIR